MPSDKRTGNLNTAVAGLLILAVLSMCFLALWLRKPSRSPRSPATQGIDALRESVRSGVLDETGDVDPELLIKGRKASIGQIKPGGGGLMPSDDVPARPFSRDFHKLPDAYFAPQSPADTRRAVDIIRELREEKPHTGPASKKSGPPSPGKGGASK